MGTGTGTHGIELDIEPHHACREITEDDDLEGKSEMRK